MSDTDTNLRLWLDWCTARDVDPDRVGWEDVEAFVVDVPSAAATTVRRLNSIRAHYERRHQELAGAPEPDTARLWPADADRGLLEGRLWALPVYGFPHGVAGRRDAVVHVLAAMGLTRAQIIGLTPSAVSFDPVLAIRGVDVDMTNHGLRCSKCAVTRWLRVLSRWWAPDGEHSVEREVEQQPVDVRQHDCARPLPDGWRSALRLVCGVDCGVLVRPTIGPRAVTRALARTVESSSLDEGPAAGTAGVIPVESPHPTSFWRGPTPAERAGPLREISDLLDQLDQELAVHLGENGAPG